MFPLHCIPKILNAESTDTELIIHAKSFPLWSNSYPQYIHYGQTDGHTDNGQQSDHNGTIDAYSVAVSASKNCVQYRPNNQC